MKISELFLIINANMCVLVLYWMHSRAQSYQILHRFLEHTTFLRMQVVTKKRYTNSFPELHKIKRTSHTYSTERKKKFRFSFMYTLQNELQSTTKPQNPTYKQATHYSHRALCKERNGKKIRCVVSRLEGERK